MSSFIFDYGWRKPITFTFNQNQFKIDCVLEAFDGEEITPEQQKAYDEFSAITQVFEEKTTILVKKYIQENNIHHAIVEPTVLYITRQGRTAVLCNTSWDKENGIAVVISPDQTVILQDDIL
ncbi:hypothetical protein A4G19_06405 [Pasteurellaceae bacterium Macca]|nr:hypothetical protein [Pasteurellaceae bacterium Macca]